MHCAFPISNFFPRPRVQQLAARSAGAPASQAQAVSQFPSSALLKWLCS